LKRLSRSLLLACAALLANPSVGASQTDEQLTEAFVLAVQRSVGEFYGGKSAFLAPLNEEEPDPVRAAAYRKLLEGGYKLYELPSWPDSMTVLVSLRGPRPLRSAQEVSVSFLLPNQRALRDREGYQPYRTSFTGFVLTCAGGACELSEAGVHGNGGGMIRLDCIPDYFRRLREERQGCTISGLEPGAGSSP